VRSPKSRRRAALHLSKELLEERAIQKVLQSHVKPSSVVKALPSRGHCGKFRNCCRVSAGRRQQSRILENLGFLGPGSQCGAQR